MPNLFRTSNPALSSKAFLGRVAVAGDAMTLQGTVNKTGVLLLCVIASAAYTWNLASRSMNPQVALPWILAGVFGGLIVAFVTIFKKEWAPVTAPIYALLEGLALGGISAFFDQMYHGIAIQAVGLTFGVLAVMLVAYTTGLIRVTQKFRIGVIAATGAIAIVYLVDLVLRMFGKQVPLLNEAGPWGIAISVVIVCVAALNLVLDFDFVESGVAAGAPKYMEWYGAFGLMLTLIWLYLEILRLLGKVRRR
jgi:uncharacterized YccA/Bax inhibitor family protein